MKEKAMDFSEIMRARRLVLGQIIAAGGVPRPEQFQRAGLPPLFRASSAKFGSNPSGTVPAESAKKAGRRPPGPAF